MFSTILSAIRGRLIDLSLSQLSCQSNVKGGMALAYMPGASLLFPKIYLKSETPSFSTLRTKYLILQISILGQVYLGCKSTEILSPVISMVFHQRKVWTSVIYSFSLSLLNANSFTASFASLILYLVNSGKQIKGFSHL